ncbi:MAG: hypothetical protein RLY16_1279 [Bacteroidota bacterium]
MKALFKHTVQDIAALFDNRYLQAKMLYLYLFNELPQLDYFNQVDGEKVFQQLQETFANAIQASYGQRWQTVGEKEEFDRRIIVFNKHCIVELDSYYAEVWHNGKEAELVNAIRTIITQQKRRQRRKPLEINLIVRINGRLELKAMEIKRTRLDVNRYYPDDFAETDLLIRKRLNTKNDKGIVLLHGLPGTGKTTYLRHLVGRVKKRVLFLSPSVVDNLMDPGFVELLIDNPNSIIVIEDAENIIMDRKLSSNSSVSNLLNISDGLMADFLNVQLVCTFNIALTLVDPALLRKGRLIAKYEFGKLEVQKAQQLSNSLGLQQLITKPTTLAEITHPHEKEHQTDRVEIRGFSSAWLEN